MKSLTESIKESIHESANVIIMAFSHSNPECTFFIKGCSSKDLSKLNSTDLDYCELTNARGWVMFRHSDENPSAWSIKFNNENALKKYVWDEFQKYINYIEDGEVEDVEMDELGLCLSFSDADKIKNANDVWARVSDFIEDSEVDGDSSSVYGIVDINKNKEICVGQTGIIFYDSFNEFWEEMGFDEE